MDDLLKDLLADVSPPGYLVEGVDPHDVEIMMREAARLWRAQPWKRLDHFGPMALKAPDLMLTTSCLGLADDQYPAIILTHTYEDYLLAASMSSQIVAEEEEALADVPDESLPSLVDAIEAKLDASAGADDDFDEDDDELDGDDDRESLVTVYWVPGSHVPDSLRKEIASHAWEIASVDAYPIAALVDPDRGILPPTWMDLRKLAGAFAALSGLIESRPDEETIRSPFWYAARVEGSQTGVAGRIVCPHPYSVRAEGAAYRYEAELGPDLDLWVREGMDAMIDDIALYHEQRKPHPMPEGARLHAALHYGAEHHFFRGEQEAWDEYEQLMLTNISRHEAIHRTGVPIMSKAADIMQVMQSPAKKKRGRPSPRPKSKSKPKPKKKR